MSHSLRRPSATFHFNGGLSGGKVDIVVTTDRTRGVPAPFGVDDKPVSAVTVDANDLIDLVILEMDRRPLYERVMQRLLDDE